MESRQAIVTMENLRPAVIILCEACDAWVFAGDAMGFEGNIKQLKIFLDRLVSLPESEWAYLRTLIKAQKYSKGDYFVRQGEDCSIVAFVVKGVFRSFYSTDAGNELIRTFSPEGALVSPYSSQLQGLPSYVSIQALEDSEVLAFPFATYVALYARHACWQELGRKVAESQFIAKERREQQLLLLDAAHRYEEFQKEFPLLMGRVPQYHIAAYLGITPVSLSRIANCSRLKMASLRRPTDG